MIFPFWWDRSPSTSVSPLRVCSAVALTIHLVFASSHTSISTFPFIVKNTCCPCWRMTFCLFVRMRDFPLICSCPPRASTKVYCVLIRTFISLERKEDISHESPTITLCRGNMESTLARFDCRVVSEKAASSCICTCCFSKEVKGLFLACFFSKVLMARSTRGCKGSILTIFPLVLSSPLRGCSSSSLAAWLV